MSRESHRVVRWRALAGAGAMRPLPGPVLPWPGVRTWLEKTDLGLDQGWLKGQVQWSVSGLRGSGMQLGVSLTILLRLESGAGGRKREL